VGDDHVAEDMAVVQVDQGLEDRLHGPLVRDRWKSSTVVGEGWETPGVLMMV
jgi:hypothetical protein